MSKIRLKQIDEPEISGYILNVMTGINSGFNSTLTGCVYTGNTLSGAFGSLFNSFSGISGRMISFSGELATVQQDFSTFSGDLTNLSGEIYAVSGQFNSLSGDIAFISGEVDVIDTSLSSLTTSVILISGNLNTLSGNLNTTNTNLSTISGRVDTLSGLHTGLSGTVSTNTVSISGLSGTFTGFTGKYANDYLLVCDAKPSGTQGGTFTSGAWRTRDINTEISDIGNICTISSNQIILSGGLYICDISCPAYGVNSHRARLQSITSGTTILSGSSEYSANTANSTTRSVIKGKFLVPSTGSIFEIQHICNTTVSTWGFGYFGGVADPGPGIFTQAEFRRIAV